MSIGVGVFENLDLGGMCLSLMLGFWLVVGVFWFIVIKCVRDRLRMLCFDWDDGMDKIKLSSKLVL